MAELSSVLFSTAIPNSDTEHKIKITFSAMAKHRSSKNPQTHYWSVIRGIFTCRDLHIQEQHQQQQVQGHEATKKKSKKMKCSGSFCSSTKVTHRPELSASPQTQKRAPSSSSSSSSSRSMKAPLRGLNGPIGSSSFSSNSSTIGGSFRAMSFRRLSGCYECRMVVDPVLGFTRDPSLRASICTCPDCGEIFMKPENLELHQSVSHAVSELSPDDTSKNIVSIIFKSSWSKKQTPVCNIDRILKIHNTQRTIARFEQYRDSIKSKATKKHPRCVADGNELLRFHSTAVACSLGLNGSSGLCVSAPPCGACKIIRSGFAGDSAILTTATSGRAHEKAGDRKVERRAMLVCRVIAGRVRKTAAEGGGAVVSGGEGFDSVGRGGLGVYADLDELFVFDPKAILPCFVVIYSGF